MTGYLISTQISREILMRITRNKIRRLIRGSILKEQQSTPPNAGDAYAPPPNAGDALVAAARKTQRVKALAGTYNYKSSDGKTTKAVIKPDGTVFFMNDSNSITGPAAGQKPQDLDVTFVEWFEANQDKKEAVSASTSGSSAAAAKKKGPSRIAQLQKIIGDKADGKWNRKQKGNTDTDDKWKAWLEADQHRNFMVIMKLGLDKNAALPKEELSMALETNSASDLAQIAGYGKNLTGVLAMAKEVNAMSPVERHAAAMSVALSDEGETALAAKNINQEEIITDAFMEETDDIINGTADAVNKVKNQKGRTRIIQKMVEAFKQKMQDAKKRKDQKALKNLDRKFKLFTKKTKAEKLGIDMNPGGDPPEDMKESQERLSRGALYRRRYYGRY